MTPGPKKERIVSQRSFFRGELLNIGDVFQYIEILKIDDALQKTSFGAMNTRSSTSFNGLKFGACLLVVL